MFIFVVDGSLQNPVVPTFGNGITVTTVLCVVMVTVSLVLFTLLCICRKRTVVINHDTKHSSTAMTDPPPLSSSQLQLSTTESLAAVINEETNQNDRKSNELNAVLPESAAPSVHPSVQQFLLPALQEGAPVRHSSPHLPPRKPHRLLSAPLTNAVSSGPPGTTVASPGSDAAAENNSVAEVQQGAHSLSVASNISLTVAGTSGLQSNFRPATMEIADYEEVDFQGPSNSRAVERTATVADRQYDYIDLRSVKTENVSNAGIVTNCENSSELLQMDVAGVGKLSREIPQYAQVDKSKKRHSFSAKLFSNTSGEALISATDTGSSLRRKTSGSHDALYADVNKSGPARVARQFEKPSSSAMQAEDSMSRDADKISNEFPLAGSQAKGSFSEFNPKVPPKNFEEPGYAMIKDEPKKNFEEPGYSMIKEEPKKQFEEPGYSLIKDEPKKEFEEPGYSLIKDEPKKKDDEPDYSTIKDDPKKNSQAGHSATKEESKSHLNDSNYSAIDNSVSPDLSKTNSTSAVSDEKYESSRNSEADSNVVSSSGSNKHPDTAACLNFSKEPLYEDIKFDKSSSSSTTTADTVRANNITPNPLANENDAVKYSANIYETIK